VDVTSLGFRTDLALLQMGGSEIDDRGDHVVVRSPHNPLHWWGNFILLEHPPGASDVQPWLDMFHAEFPEAEHIAFGADATKGTPADMAGFEAAGLKVSAATVMTAHSVHPPPRPNLEATYRQLDSDTDGDWDQLVALGVATDDKYGDAAHHEYLVHKASTSRRLIEAGHGGWFGAFIGGQLLAAMGLFVTDDGLARFQHVETHPEARGRGLAGTLVHHASRYGLDERGAHTLVMVADPEYLAIRVYRSVGFVDGESQLQAEREPDAFRDSG
jgi:ribosomal protein S18 acetylase RimI-like enzyme